MMVFVALKPLLLLYLISYSTSGMPVEKTATVIMELARKFHSGGVYLLVSSEQISRGCWNSTLRLLAKDYLPTAVINLERAFTIPAPSERTSVYVMQSAGMKDRRQLQEVRSLCYRTFSQTL
jgi:dTDP-4-dehydrorhamnose reductase